MINLSIYGQSFCIRLYAGRILGELDKALGRPGFSALCICTLADLMQTSRRARKAPKLTGKLLLLGRNQPQWQAAWNLPKFFVSGKFGQINRGQNLQNDPWGNCILRPGSAQCNHTKLFRGSYSNCTQRQMSIMAQIGKVELNSKFGALFVNVPDSGDNNEFGLHSPYLPLLGNLQLIKPDKVSVSGNQNCANMWGINIAINMEYFTFRGRLP